MTRLAKGLNWSEEQIKKMEQDLQTARGEVLIPTILDHYHAAVLENRKRDQDYSRMATTEARKLLQLVTSLLTQEQISTLKQSLEQIKEIVVQIEKQVELIITNSITDYSNAIRALSKEKIPNAQKIDIAQRLKQMIIDCLKDRLSNSELTALESELENVAEKNLHTIQV